MDSNLPLSHPKYGGRLTYLKDLEVGDTFFVTNGYWDGEIVEVNGEKRLKVNRLGTPTTHKITDDYYVWISDLQHNKR